MASGEAVSAVSRRLHVARSTLLAWRRDPTSRAEDDGCPRCTGCHVDSSAYAALLGFYLGDGCLSQAPGYFSFRVSCDASYPRIIEDVTRLMARVRPGARIFHVQAPGTVVVQSNWKHWPCLFPQHGPGRKHERRIALVPWQQEIVNAHPDQLVRGLIHSDGSRHINRIKHPKRTYEYVRYALSNRSDDIKRIFCEACDALGVQWRVMSRDSISVARRASVARLDEFIGPKR